MATWSNQHMLDFIEEYRKHECLWRVKTKAYHNRDLKDAAYSKLLELTKTFLPEATEDTVLKKIYNLRSSFRKEQKKVMCGKKSGMGADEVYNPKLWYFKELSFLADEEEGLLGKSNVDELSENQDEVCGNRGNGRDTSNTDTTIEIPEEPDEHSVSSPNNNPDEPPAKKSFKRGKTLTPADQVLVSVGERLAEMKKEDNCDIFAKNVAVKLRSLTKEQRLCAEKLINETLFEAEMGVLTRYSTINTPSFTSPYYDQPMYNYPQPMQPLSSGMEPVSRPASSRSSNLEYEYQGYDCQTGSAKQFTPISSTSPAGFQTPPTHHGHSQNQ